MTRWSPRTITITSPRSSTMTGYAFSSAPGGTPQRPRDLGDGRQARRVDELGRGEPVRQLTGCGVGAGDLDVGRVAGRERDVVLARRARRHVLVRADAAHHPDVGLHPVPLEPDAVEDPVVGLAVALVVRVEPLAVAVEGVGVLHDELARAQHAGARARLVALLGLEVVEAERQVAVGAHDLGDVRRHGLLVASAPAQSAPLRSWSLNSSSIGVAAAALPQLRRVAAPASASPGRRSRSAPRG